MIVAVAVGWSSVFDNPVLCSDEIGGVPISSDGPCSNEGGAPASPAACTGCPCRLPTIETRVLTRVVPPASVALPIAELVPQVLDSADQPAPPTPPPTLLA